MIQKIRSSRTFKGLSLTTALVILFEIIQPTVSFALTGGPAQPEFNSFTPIGTSDMVNLSSGDMSYNIPLMDVGGYPLNISYDGPPSMDQEASWVGLGWNLSVGQINRNVRGIPDDFNGDVIKYEDYLKKNITVGASFRGSANLFGVDAAVSGGLSVGLSAVYNNYAGFTLKPSVGITISLGDNLSLGFNAESGPDGMNLSPRLSLSKKVSGTEDLNNSLSASVGVSINSRQGLTSMTLGMSANTQETANLKAKRREAGDHTSLSSSVSKSSTIGFIDQLHTPSKRVGMKTGTFTVNVAAGGEIYGVEVQGDISAFGTVSKVANPIRNIRSFGYNNTHSAGITDILDFNREKDGPVGVNTSNLSLTNYTYDIYSVQGQGVSGQYRPFRNQIGYIYDPLVYDESLSNTLGLEVGGGNTVHAGFSTETSPVVSLNMVWNNNNHLIGKLKHSGTYPQDYEIVHHKNVGDLSSDLDYEGFMSKTGQYDAVRPDFNQEGRRNFYRYLKPSYVRKSSQTGNEETINVSQKISRQHRHLRNQTIFNITFGEMEQGVGYGPAVRKGGNTPEVSLANSTGISHHTGEVQIIRNDGARYVYGYPAFNTKKVESTFSVSSSSGDLTTGLVPYSGNVSADNAENLPGDKFLNKVTTPKYVHTHLLTSVLSTDYQDRGNNGPTPDDYGTYTKFVYKKMHDNYRWRVPYEQNKATYNEGLKTDTHDDRGNYVYGEKEIVLIDKIMTKTHVATFHYSSRHDAHGVLGESGGRDNSMDSYKLDSIKLYSINEEGGTPIKTVHLSYTYDLCKGIPNNDGIQNSGGKLTLKKLYFTYRNSAMGKYTAYRFYYREDDANYNPNYNIKSYDAWGNYKAYNSSNSIYGDPNSSEFPYTDQEKATQDLSASAWALSKIELPSGGDISIEYESDDYNYVQNKKAMRMFKIAGVGFSPDPNSDDISTTQNTGVLFTGQIQNKPKNYLYVEVDTVFADPNEAIQKYIGELKNSPIYFRSLMNMTKIGGVSDNVPAAKYDYVTGYFQIDQSNPIKNVYSAGNRKILSIPLKLVPKGKLSTLVNPLSRAAWQFGRKYLSNHVFSMQPNGDSEDIKAIATKLVSPGVLNNLKEVFTGPNATLENKNIGRRFIKKKSWIRLKNPRDVKYGGGSRVKTIKMSDNWEDMQSTNNQTFYQTMKYGQRYNYTIPGGKNESSGVATYEPMGNKDNPFVQPVYSTTKHLLAPDEDNYVEKPFGESFFPAPTVTYSRVEVSNLQAGTNPNSSLSVKQTHKTGKVITEFYTSKDYPVIVDQTKMLAKEDKSNALANLLSLRVKKHFMATQGYVVHLNDMNGKQKAQWVYAEGQDEPISGVRYLYENYESENTFSASSVPNLNKGRLNNEVVTISPKGTVQRNTIGVEIDIVNDFRESRTESRVVGVNMNLATFLVGIFPGIVPVPLPDFSSNQNQLRIATTTKVINSFGILKETIAYDAGASVSTKNLAWDQSTGEVLLTETVDEFDDKYYTLNYPAHWNYDGMAQASRNIGLTGSITNNGNGNYTVGSYANLMLPGDELNLVNASGSNQIAWVNSVSGSSISLISRTGGATTFDATSFKVIRSGRRNLQSAGIMNVTLKKNPLITSNGQLISNLLESNGFLKANNNEWSKWEIINAGAVDYSDTWQANCECSDLRQSASIRNPYTTNQKGVWRTKSSRTYLTGRNYHDEVTPRRQGFFNKFSPMYKLTSIGNWDQDTSGWTYVAEVSEFSPFGFELENKDALNRHSAAQYGYNNSFPIAVGANTKYSEIGFDGFEEHHGQYGLEKTCPNNPHFAFIGPLSNQHSHTGRYSLNIVNGQRVTMKKTLSCTSCCKTFAPQAGRYWVSAWVKETHGEQKLNYGNSFIKIFTDQGSGTVTVHPSGEIIDGWQRIVGDFSIAEAATDLTIELGNNGAPHAYFDDVRVHPFNASMKSYVYDPVTLWLTAELDDNNYATFYEYDSEGQLIRIKKETARGVMTIQESRSSNPKKAN